MEQPTLFLYISYSLDISQSFSTSFSRKARSSAEIYSGTPERNSCRNKLVTYKIRELKSHWWLCTALATESSDFP